jgi:hypothetical protein
MAIPKSSLRSLAHWLWLPGLIAATALFVPTFLHEPRAFDEGFIVTGAMTIAHGGLPYRDFYSIYGPAQYYVTAALYAAFGSDLIVSRIGHAATLAGMLVAVVACTRIATEGSPGLIPVVIAVFCAAVVLVVPGPGYPSIAATLCLLASTVAFSEWATDSQRRRLIAASCLAGFAGLFRWDSGLLGVAALALSAVIASPHRRGSMARTSADVLAASLPGFALLIIGCIPLIVLGGARRWYDEVLYYSLFEYGNWRSLVFLHPAYWSLAGGLQEGDAARVADGLLRFAFAATPYVSVAGLAICARRAWRGGGDVPPAVRLVLLLSIICIMLLNQMRVRSTLWQGFAAFTAALPIAAWLIHRARPARAVSRMAIGAVGVLSIAAVVSIVVARTLAAIGEPRIDGSVPRSTLLHADEDSYPGWQQYGDMIRFVRERTPADEPIFSGVVDTSRLFINDAMIYFLADRQPAVRFVEMEPGITNTEAGQRRLVAALERRRVGTVVLWNKVSREPNRSAVSNGVHVLDDYIRNHYREGARFGAYTVLVRD